MIFVLVFFCFWIVFCQRPRGVTLCRAFSTFSSCLFFFCSFRRVVALCGAADGSHAGCASSGSDRRRSSVLQLSSFFPAPPHAVPHPHGHPAARAPTAPMAAAPRRRGVRVGSGRALSRRPLPPWHAARSRAASTTRHSLPPPLPPRRPSYAAETSAGACCARAHTRGWSHALTPRGNHPTTVVRFRVHHQQRRRVSRAW